jgi:hypothetical protein
MMTIMTDPFRALVPPAPLATERWWLEPLGPEHHERDHRAWGSSIEHIRRTPGFTASDWNGDAWPYEMPAEQNLADLVMHAGEFERGEAYAYSVLERGDDRADVIGCVYIDPDPTAERVVVVRSWVTERRAHLDHDLASNVDAWLRDTWRATSVRWPGRPTLGSGANRT